MSVENILGYRHFVDERMKKIFIESLKEAVEEIKLKKLGFVGIIGSVDRKHSHDIDVMMFPSEKARIGEAILEMIQLYDKVSEIIKKKHCRYYISACPRKTAQELVYYLSSLEEGSAGLIPIHSLFFTDYISFERLNPTNFTKEIKKTLITIYGDFEIIRKLKPLPQEKIEPYFWIIDFEMNARIKNFPKHLIRASAESLFEYLGDKYKINSEGKNVHEIKEIEKTFLKLLKKIDDENYSK